MPNPPDHREKKFKHWQCERLNGRWLYQYHEDKYLTGVPDVSFAIPDVNGWVEYKSLPTEPTDPGKIVKFPKFTGRQRDWLQQRGEMAGHCFMCFNFDDTGNFFLVPHVLIKDNDWMTLNDYRGLNIFRGNQASFTHQDKDQFINVLATRFRL